MEDRMRILLMDQDGAAREQLGNQLRLYGMAVSEARKVAEAKRLLQQGRFDLALLDLPSPGLETLALCRSLGTTSALPVILLAWNDDPVQLVAGFGSGADDYMVKPCSPCEVILRINAVLRRTKRALGPRSEVAGGRYRFAGWLFDLEKRRLLDPAGTPVPISAAELRLLRVLVAHPHTVLSRERLLELTAGGEAQAFDRSIDSQVSRLRKKIEADPRRPQLLKTAWGNGYILAAEVSPADDTPTQPDNASLS
jgi:two-component system OmpR family response regulator